MILRIEKTKSYTVIDNALLEDRRLSFAARGLAAYLLSLPDDWRINADDLERRSERDGRCTVRAAMRELTRAGYITRHKHQDELGRWTTSLCFHEVPVTPTGDQPTTGSPTYRKPTVGAPNVGEPTALPNTHDPILRTNTHNQPLPDGESEGLGVSCPEMVGGGDDEPAHASVASSVDQPPPSTAEQAPIEDAIPPGIRDLWLDTFDELTEKQTKFLRNELTAHGHVMVSQAICGALDAVRSGRSSSC